MLKRALKHVKRFLVSESGSNPYGIAGGIIITMLLIALIYTASKTNLSGTLNPVGTGLGTAGSTAGSQLGGMN